LAARGFAEAKLRIQKRPQGFGRTDNTGIVLVRFAARVVCRAGCALSEKIAMTQGQR